MLDLALPPKPPIELLKPAIIRPAPKELIRPQHGLLTPPAWYIPPKSQVKMIDAITALGIGTDLEMCLDPRDAASATSSSTDWLDVSGNGHDFWRGVSGSADSVDPTFVGATGASDAYWTFDGGDYFRLKSSTSTFFNSIHKANALFTFASWVYLNATNFHFFLCSHSANNAVGFDLRTGSTNGLTFVQGDGTNVLSEGFDTMPIGEWQFIWFAGDQANGICHGGRRGRNSERIDVEDYETIPSASDSSSIYIGARTGGSLFYPSGTRQGPIVAWSRYVSLAEITKLYNVTKPYYGHRAA